MGLLFKWTSLLSLSVFRFIPLQPPPLLVGVVRILHVYYFIFFLRIIHGSYDLKKWDLFFRILKKKKTFKQI